MLWDIMTGIAGIFKGAGDDEPDNSPSPYDMARNAAADARQIVSGAKVSPRAGRYFTPGKTPDAGFPIRKQLPGIATLGMDRGRLANLLRLASLKSVDKVATLKVGLPTGSQSTVG